MSFEYSTPAITKWNLDELLEIIDAFEDVFADAVHHKLSIKKDYNTILLHIAGKTLVTTKNFYYTKQAEGFYRKIGFEEGTGWAKLVLRKE